MRLGVLFAALAALATVSASGASAAPIQFGCISGSSAADCAIGEVQLSADVVAGPGANQASFTFFNVGSSAASITDIYFDDGTLLGIASITSSAGVSFSQGATPGNLPAGNNASPPFVATAGFTADSNAPVQPSGVNPGEWVTIVFDLQSGGTIADVLAELADGSLRIGVHVQGFASGGSESFVNTPVPEPSGLSVLALTGAFTAAHRARRRARQALRP